MENIKEICSELIEYAKELGLKEEDIKEFFQENEWLMRKIQERLN